MGQLSFGVITPIIKTTTPEDNCPDREIITDFSTVYELYIIRLGIELVLGLVLGGSVRDLNRVSCSQG